MSCSLAFATSATRQRHQNVSALRCQHARRRAVSQRELQPRRSQQGAWHAPPPADAELRESDKLVAAADRAYFADIFRSDHHRRACMSHAVLCSCYTSALGSSALSLCYTSECGSHFLLELRHSFTRLVFRSRAQECPCRGHSADAARRQLTPGPHVRAVVTAGRHDTV